jgi:predicted lipoprotein with Yx(FWY)xxD motif
MLVAVMAFGLIACKNDKKNDNNPTATAAETMAAETSTPMVGETGTPMAGETETPGAVETPGEESYTIATAGGLVTGADGMTLYTFDNDTATTSACGADCVGTWPPLIVTEAPTADESVTGTVGTITRDDGSMQATYNSKPLYYYAPDTAPGDKGGDGIGGVWHVATP